MYGAMNFNGRYGRLGPLHTWAKNRDHEIVRAQKKVLKVVLRHLQNHVMWSRILKYSVKAYVTGPSTKCYFNTFLFMPVLMHDKIAWVNGYEH